VTEYVRVLAWATHGGIILRDGARESEAVIVRAACRHLRAGGGAVRTAHVTSLTTTARGLRGDLAECDACAPREQTVSL
jgi:hypothetical protein